jgi:anaerobic selenocysteine-containing dehydrogenase
MEEYVTACPRNCYSTCTFRVQVENNTIRRILPYSENLATPEGPCIKGLSYIERTHSPDRIIHPLIKTSTGKFEEIGSKEVLDIIAAKLNSIKSEFGTKISDIRSGKNSGEQQLHMAICAGRRALKL